MARFRCIKCGEPPDGFLFEADLPTCPRCYASGPLHIVQLVDVHFMVMDPKGPIQGAQGRQYVACQRKREYLLLHTMDTFGAATDDPSVVTCRSCRGTKEWQAAALLDPTIALRQAQQERLQKIIASDCCG